jgi:hypothetical protein
MESSTDMYREQNKTKYLSEQFVVHKSHQEYLKKYK